MLTTLCVQFAFLSQWIDVNDDCYQYYATREDKICFLLISDSLQ